MCPFTNANLYDTKQTFARLFKDSFVQAELEETVREAERKEEELERLRDERDTIQG